MIRLTVGIFSSPEESLIRLDPRHTRSTGKPTEHRFDAVLTGSDNRLVYQRTARKHVIAAMVSCNLCSDSIDFQEFYGSINRKGTTAWYLRMGRLRLERRLRSWVTRMSLVSSLVL